MSGQLSIGKRVSRVLTRMQYYEAAVRPGMDLGSEDPVSARGVACCTNSELHNVVLLARLCGVAMVWHGGITGMVVGTEFNLDNFDHVYPTAARAQPSTILAHVLVARRQQLEDLEPGGEVARVGLARVLDHVVEAYPRLLVQDPHWLAATASVRPLYKGERPCPPVYRQANGVLLTGAVWPWPVYEDQRTYTNWLASYRAHPFNDVKLPSGGQG